MNQDTILKRASHVTFEVVAGEAILIDMNTGTYFSLDEVGTVFWELLDGAQTLAELAGQIARHYNEKAARYVTELGQLGQSGTAISADSKQELAMEFGLEEDEVTEHLQRLGLDDAAASQLVADFSVEPQQVLGDLYDLAATMQADNLIVSVK